MRDSEDKSLDLVVKPATETQIIETPCCGKEMVVIITDLSSGVHCDHCSTKINYCRRDRGDGEVPESKQTELVS